jgi:hypothetical protein
MTMPAKNWGDLSEAEKRVEIATHTTRQLLYQRMYDAVLRDSRGATGRHPRNIVTGVGGAAAAGRGCCTAPPRMRVDIKEGAQLTVAEGDKTGPRFARYRPHSGSAGDQDEP